MTKCCGKCEAIKSVDEFYKKTASTRQSYCKPCFNAYCVQRWRQKKKDAVLYKGGICEDCSGEFHPNVYDFHHVGEKDFVWTKLRLRSWTSIKEELDKCALLCSNCHRIRHIDDS